MIVSPAPAVRQPRCRSPTTSHGRRLRDQVIGEETLKWTSAPHARLECAVAPGFPSSPAGVTAKAGPETRTATPRRELGTYQNGTDTRGAHVRCENVYVPAPEEDPRKPTNRRKVSADISRGREVAIEHVVALSIAETIEQSHLPTSHLVYTRKRLPHLVSALS